MGVGYTSRRGSITVNQTTSVVTNVTGLDPATILPFKTQQEAEDAGLGIGDVFKYAPGSIEGSSGTFVEILELL